MGAIRLANASISTSRLAPPKGDIGITGAKNKALARDIRGISEIDAYLHSKVGSPAHQRVVVIGKRVLEIAEKLRY